MITKGKKPGIVAFVPDSWQEQRQARHHLAEGLSRLYPVLWISPPVFVETIRRQGLRKSLNGTGLGRISPSLWCYAPCVPADYKRSGNYRNQLVAAAARLYRGIWRKLLLRKIANLARNMGVDRVLLYIWRPDYAWAVGGLAEDAVFYQIDDEYSFNPDSDEPVSNEEEKLIRRADAVFIHSKTMMEKKGRINAHTYCVPNGVDFAKYAEALAAVTPEPSDLRDIPRPRIGYIGHIKRHIDLDLLLEMARRRIDWSFVLIGPLREDHDSIRSTAELLKTLPNVYFVGGKPANELPSYARGFDVAIMPYRKTHYTRHIYPMKMHEYLAAGKPVVSTPLENISEFSEVVSFADSISGWIDAIERELTTDSEDRRNSRIAVAYANRWSERVRVIHEVIEGTLKRLDSPDPKVSCHLHGNGGKITDSTS